MYYHLMTEEEKEVSIPFKREGVSERCYDNAWLFMLLVSIPFKREGVSEQPCFIVDPVIICTHLGTVWVGLPQRNTQAKTPLRAKSVNLFSDFTINPVQPWLCTLKTKRELRRAFLK